MKLSLTTKVMIILMAMMLTLSVTISALLLHQSSVNIENRHHEAQLQNLERFTLFEQLLNTRIVMWVDAFLNAQWNSAEDLNSLADTIRRAREYLYINMQVEDIWLYASTETQLYSDGATLPSIVYPLIEQTQNSLASQHTVYCEATCLSYITVPIMANSDEVPVVVLTTKMQELLSLLSQATGALKLAVVKQAPQAEDGSPTLRVVSRLTPTNLNYVHQAINQLLPLSNIDKLIETGVRTQLNNRAVLVSLLPLNHARSKNTYILFVHDIESSVVETRMYEKLVIASAAGLFVLFAILLYLFLNVYRYKLIDLSKRLPLLSQHRYQEFKRQGAERKKWHRSRFIDELDVLEDAANDLANKLEDIDSQMAMNTQQLERMAMFDALTGLPNRNMLTFQIEQQIAQTGRTTGLVALMFLDLDDFKKVNDSYGHDVGDRLLKAAALRISRPIRETDIASRFGGDEFVILLSNIDEREKVEQVANKVLEEFSTPISVGDLEFYISVSIGIAISRHSQVTAGDLLRHADIAMYEAKAMQGAAFKIYDANMNLKVMRKVELESEARVALRDDQFSLALQPQVEISSGKLVGFEALLRWEHPEKGFVSPGEFIPMLENTPFMLELNYWVIARATRLLRELNANGYRDIKMSINISSAHFLDPSLPDYLIQQIQKNDIVPGSIALELTETVLVSDLGRATAVMKAIRSLGCLIAIDDFGTGYSSLSYLKALPADFIKIDQSFIAGMIDSPDDRSIVHSTINMVRNMGLTVIAEGLEEPDQYRLLNEFGCQLGQGYFISRPIMEADLYETLRKNVNRQIWTIDLPVSTA